MKLEDMTALLMEALEEQCEQGDAPRFMMIESDDFSSVSVEGSFDIRGLAAAVLAKMPKDEAPVPANTPGRVEYEADGGLRITLPPGSLRRIG